MSNRLPLARGPLSERILTLLPAGRTHRLPTTVAPIDAPLVDDDLHLSLHVLYGLHHEGFTGVDDDVEWDPAVVRLRTALEAQFLAALRAEQTAPAATPGDTVADTVADTLRAVIAEGGGTPSPSRHLADAGTLDQLHEMLIHRSIYQRKEADGHTWAIPRLRGEAKSALVLIQADEYGMGVPGRTHAELFGVTMERLGLDPTPGAYIDVVPGVTLATDNLVSLFGLRRSLRGALVGHLAVFEMTSVVPMGRYAAAVRRLTGDEVAAEFYDVHVAADAEHEIVAADHLAAGFVRSEPERAGDVLFGARAVMAAEARLARHLVGRWTTGRSSLRTTPTAAGATMAPPDLRVAG